MSPQGVGELMSKPPPDVSRYIETAAQHAANKGRTYGSGGTGSDGGGGGGGGNGNSGSSGGGFTMGRSSLIYLPESLSQAVYVPTQKITTLHPGAGVAVTVAAAAAAAAAAAGRGDGGYGGGAKEGERWKGGGGRAGEEGVEGLGEDNVDVRLCSPALSACPSLLQTVTGERGVAVSWL